MIVVCADCAKEGRPWVLGKKEPLDDPSVSHGICNEHAARLREEIRARRYAAEGDAFAQLVDFLTVQAPETLLRDGRHVQVAFVAKARGGLDIVALPDAPMARVETFLRGAAASGALCLALVAEAWCTAARDATDLEAVELWKAERGSLEDLPGRWEELLVTVSAPGRHRCRRWRIERADGQVRLGEPRDEAAPSRLWRGLWAAP